MTGALHSTSALLWSVSTPSHKVFTIITIKVAFWKLLLRAMLCQIPVSWYLSSTQATCAFSLIKLFGACFSAFVAANTFAVRLWMVFAAVSCFALWTPSCEVGLGSKGAASSSLKASCNNRRPSRGERTAESCGRRSGVSGSRLLAGGDTSTASCRLSATFSSITCCTARNCSDSKFDVVLSMVLLAWFSIGGICLEPGWQA
mmetsp:Transcript_35019/g.78828  ORF Transcript_35019/g.78828 Transcript_35019/m.78828 type:complete len:202 (-) Transcript_35019:3-608(-)